jgi:hypothetical protein
MAGQADDDDKADASDERTALAGEGEDDALLGVAAADSADDDAPAPETGLHALGQLGTAVVVVAAVVAVVLLAALVFGRLFH